MSNCIFCKIIKGAIPSLKVAETELSYAFLDISPLSRKHVLVVPKAHGRYIEDIPDENLAEIGPLIKKIAKAIGASDYNVLQNNGAKAMQSVEHVHFHIVPRDDDSGLKVKWDSLTVPQEELQKDLKEITARLQ